MREEAPPPAPSYTPIALRIWNEATDSTGTSTQEYLASRAITAPLPPSIRHHAHLLHKPSALHLPAMVAAVAGADGEIVGIHRTYITPDGSGKADVDPPRMMLGACAGAAVWMALPAPVMAVAEGIETALSVWQATGIATWAVMSTTGLELVNLPALPMASEVVIAADGDAPGRAAADRAARRFTSEGRRVRIAHPPEGLDFNDLAQREGNQHDDD